MPEMHDSLVIDFEYEHPYTCMMRKKTNEQYEEYEHFSRSDKSNNVEHVMLLEV